MRVIHPENETAWLELRTTCVSSTESAALFGMSPYVTEFELWHRKRSREVGSIPDNERMKWGRRLERPIAEGIAEDRGWKVRKLNAYMIHDECRMGASFDFEIIDHQDGPGILEIKNVDPLVFRRDWVMADDGSIEAPAHIEVQVQHQLEVCGREWAAIAALVGGNTPTVLLRKRDHAVGAAIRTKVDAFWAAVDGNREPTPDFRSDAAFISKLYCYADPDKLHDARGDDKIAALCRRYKECGDAEANAHEDKQAAKAELLTLIGTAEKVLVDGFTIGAGLVGPADVSYRRDGYRNFRVTQKKAKA